MSHSVVFGDTEPVEQKLLCSAQSVLAGKVLELRCVCVRVRAIACIRVCAGVHVLRNIRKYPRTAA